MNLLMTPCLLPLPWDFWNIFQSSSLPSFPSLFLEIVNVHSKPQLEFPLAFHLLYQEFWVNPSKILAMVLYKVLHLPVSWGLDFCLWVSVICQYFSWVFMISWVGIHGDIVTKCLHISIYILPLTTLMTSSLGRTFLVAGLSSQHYRDLIPAPSGPRVTGEKSEANLSDTSVIFFFLSL